MKRFSMALMILLFISGMSVSAFGAVTVDSIKVVKPDTLARGVLVGIDSLIVIEVFAATQDTMLDLQVWLVDEGTSTPGTAYTNALTAGAAADISTNSNVTPFLISDGGGSFINTSDSDSSFTIAGASTKWKYERRNLTAADGSTKENLTVLTWYYNLEASVGTIPADLTAKVGAIARVKRTTTAAWTNLPWTRRSNLIALDGDRPRPPSATTFTGKKISQSTQKGYLGIGDSLITSLTLQDVDQQDSVTVHLALTPIVQIDTAAATKKMVTLSLEKAPALRDVIDAGEFGNRTSSTPPVIGFLKDKAGNMSSSRTEGPDDPVAVGVTASAVQVNYLEMGTWKMTSLGTIDAVRLTFENTAKDTLYPAAGDTISDGDINIGTINPVVDDMNPIRIAPEEDLDTLVVTFEAVEKDSTTKLTIGTQALINFVDHAGDIANAHAIQFDSSAVVQSGNQFKKTGMYNVTFSGKDLAGNAVTAVTASNVYLDTEESSFSRVFPKQRSLGLMTGTATGTIAGGLADTVSTNKVTFKLSEVADSVLIVMKGLTSPDKDTLRKAWLNVTERMAVTTEKEYAVSGLKDDVWYELRVLAFDLGGNATIEGPDTLLYDDDYTFPTISTFQFRLADGWVFPTPAAGAVSGETVAAGVDTVMAGTKQSLELRAVAADTSRRAVTYRQSGVKIEARSVTETALTGLTLGGTGVTQDTLADGTKLLTATLDSDAWSGGLRTIEATSEAAPQRFVLVVTDSLTTGIPTAQSDTLHYIPNQYSGGKFVVEITGSAHLADTVATGQTLNVKVTVSDKYGNERTGDTRYVEFSASVPDVELPKGSQKVAGNAMFKMRATAATDSLVVMVKDIVPKSSTTSALKTDEFITGTSQKIVVTGDVVIDPGAPLDAPDMLVGEDYMGADGQGDQGGFVLLTWDNSSDHATISGYRIYREILVNYTARADTDTVSGKVVMLEEPMQKFVPWAEVDAVPGVEVTRAVVPTLDNVATRWGVAAERGSQTTATVATGGAASKTVTVAAKLIEADEAAGSVVSDLVASALTKTEDVVKAIDNIPPASVKRIKAVDTPDDQGGSVTVTWTRSLDDKLVSSIGPNGTVYQASGVASYNVYRKAPGAEYVLVGKAAPGESMLIDDTAFTGIRYVYTVKAADLDNEVDSKVEQVAVAVRNDAVDEAGQPILGLFGQDNRVGVDDFFLFTDMYGLTSADDAFDAAFDLDQDGKVNLGDFFVFVEYFGKTTGGAAKIVPVAAGLNPEVGISLALANGAVRVGEEFVLDVMVSQVASLRGYGFAIRYDESLFEFSDAVAGEDNLLNASGAVTPMFLTVNTPGELVVASVITEGGEISEAGLAARISFKVIQGFEGESSVDVADGLVLDQAYMANEVKSLGSARIVVLPDQYELSQNYPNPFNPTTTIKYALPEPADVKIQVYNIVGQVVRTLVDEGKMGGYYRVYWDGRDDSDYDLASGVYFYRIVAGEFHAVKKMLLVK